MNRVSGVRGRDDGRRVYAIELCRVLWNGLSF